MGDEVHQNQRKEKEEMIDLYDPSGKDIFEAKYIDATFDPKTRMYK